MLFIICSFVHLFICVFVYFQDLQAEVDAHQGTYDSLNSAGNQLANKMGHTDIQHLHRRLEEMNQRWMSLMTKSMQIRYRSVLQYGRINCQGSLAQVLEKAFFVSFTKALKEEIKIACKYQIIGKMHGNN